MYRQKMFPNVPSNIWKVWYIQLGGSLARDLLLLLEVSSEGNALDQLVESKPPLSVLDQRVGQELKKA